MAPNALRAAEVGSDIEGLGKVGNTVDGSHRCVYR